MRFTTSIVMAGAAVLAAMPALAADLGARRAPAFAPVPVVQQPVGGFYFATRTGIGMPEDTSFRLGGNGLGSVLVDNEYELGAMSFVGLGYSFGPTLGGGITPRFEIEGFFGQASVDQHRVNGFPIESIDSFGDLRTYGGFASGYIEFNFGTLFGANGGFFGAISPFFGGGVGMAQVELRRQGVSATGVVMDDDDTGFAYHLSAGVGIDLARLGFGGVLFDRSTLEIGYRFMEVPDLEFTARDLTRSQTDFTSNMVTVGFRRQF
jgi:opacity protein-like surface antigen